MLKQPQGVVLVTGGLWARSSGYRVLRLRIYRLQTFKAASVRVSSLQSILLPVFTLLLLPEGCVTSRDFPSNGSDWMVSASHGGDYGPHCYCHELKRRDIACWSLLAPES